LREPRLRPLSVGQNRVVGKMAGDRATYSEAGLAARLREFEREYRMSSNDFFARWEARELPLTDVYFVWAGLCGRLGIHSREPA
jgi:hypothetical protein